jgi:hypothetical protein
LSVNLTIPSAQSDSQAFDLHIMNTPNPESDQITLMVADLSNVSFTFGNGVVISDLNYAVQGNNGWFDDSRLR